MMQPSSLVFLIMGLLLKLACMNAKSTTESAHFQFTNMNVNLYPGFFNMTWECNITKAMEEYDYSFIFQKSPQVPVNISKCSYEYYIPHEREFEISYELHILILVTQGDTIVMNKSQIVTQKGNPNTSAENFTCSIYNVFIMNCSWSVGNEAPKDTQYSLHIRHNEINDMCKDYSVDSYGRQIGCVFRTTNIPFDDDVYFQVVGSSNEASVQFLDGHFKPDSYVILDPPRNISVKVISNELEITWQPPETKTKFSINSFLYSINISGEIYVNISGKSFITSNVNLYEKVIVSMRVKFVEITKNWNWSRWSNPIKTDLSPNSASLNINLFIIGIVTAVLLIILILLCHRLKIWKRLFPQVPQPAEKIFDLMESKELSEESISLDKCLSEKQEDEECICSHITEISQKRNSHS